MKSLALLACLILDNGDWLSCAAPPQVEFEGKLQPMIRMECPICGAEREEICRDDQFDDPAFADMILKCENGHRWFGFRLEYKSFDKWTIAK